MNYTTINLQLGQEEREVEVQYNYTPAIIGEGLEPDAKEEFELVSLLDTEEGCYLVHEDDMGHLLDVLADEIIILIKEQKQQH